MSGPCIATSWRPAFRSAIVREAKTAIGNGSLTSKGELPVLTRCSLSLRRTERVCELFAQYHSPRIAVVKCASSCPMLWASTVGWQLGARKAVKIKQVNQWPLVEYRFIAVFIEKRYAIFGGLANVLLGEHLRYDTIGVKLLPDNVMDTVASRR